MPNMKTDTTSETEELTIEEEVAKLQAETSDPSIAPTPAEPAENNRSKQNDEYIDDTLDDALMEQELDENNTKDYW